MGIQHLRIDRFLIKVQDTYKKIAKFFDATDYDDWPSDRHSEIKSAFNSEAKGLAAHIKHGKFVSEQSRQKVEDDLFTAIELMREVRPESPLIDDVVSLQHEVASIVLSDG